MSDDARVLVDTSAWLDYFAGAAPAVSVLDGLMNEDRIVICGQVTQEVLQGARDDRSLTKLEHAMFTWSHVAEVPEDFVEAARLYARLRWKGVTVPPSDCLIAAVAKR